MKTLIWLALCAFVALSRADDDDRRRWCAVPAFKKTTCSPSYKTFIIAGADGKNGLNGKRGHPGPKGPPGSKSRFCGKKTCKIPDVMHLGFEKLKRDLDWMTDTLDRIDGIDIKNMNKDELVKIIFNQNKKIVDDHDIIDKLDKEIKKLKKKLKHSGGTIKIIDELKKKLTKQIKLTKLKDKKIKELNHKCSMINNAMKENKHLKRQINALKNKIHRLGKLLKETGHSVKNLRRLHRNIRNLHNNLKRTTHRLQAEIRRLKRKLRAKGYKNGQLTHKLRNLERRLRNARRVCNHIKHQNHRILNHCRKLRTTCNRNARRQHRLINTLRRQFYALKRKCRNLNYFRRRIHNLEAKIRRLAHKKKSKPKFSRNSIVCSGNPGHRVTTIPNNKVRFFRKYKRGNIQLPCARATDGSRNWFVLLNRKDGSVNFKRGFSAYVQGFGHQRGEFWLGLRAAHILTSAHHFKLRIELEDHKGRKYYANYKKFRIGPANGYRLRIGGFHGNIYNALRYHRNQRFSTFDKDQDATHRRNCARGNGGWWYKRCHYCVLTGKWHSRWTNDKHGLRWRARRRRRMYNSYYSWKKARMLIKPVYHHG